MPKMPIECSIPDCHATATHKVAAPWSYGRFAELKTYGLACDEHDATVLETARRRRKHYAIEPGEVVEEIAVFDFTPQA